MSDNSKRSSFNPVISSPAPSQVPMLVMVDPSFLRNQHVIPRERPTTVRPFQQMLQLQEDLGYRRFLVCSSCTKVATIFVCYNGSMKSKCGGNVPTHTHVDCDCQKSVFSGEVQFATKRDTIVQQQRVSAEVEVEVEK